MERWNVSSQGGSARAQVTDQVGTPLDGFTFEDCKPFSGDDTAWSPEWRSGKRMGSLRGQFIRVEVELNSARRYAIRGEYVETMPMAIARHRAYGEIPSSRIGW